MAGINQDVLYGVNVDFTGTFPVSGQVNQDGELLIGAAVAPFIRSALLTAGPGISIANGPGSITISVSGVGFTWNVVTSADNTVQVVIANGYIAKGASTVIFLLPAAAAIGDTFTILGYGNLWKLTQNAGQTVFLGSQTTTVGVTGSLTATMIKDRIEVICVTANTEFEVVTSIGNLTVV